MARKMLIQVRRDTAANWTSVNPTLASGEHGLETDTGRVKIGDGSTAWTSLVYVPGTIGARKNSAGSTYQRRRLNFIEGSNVTITVTDDSTDQEVDVTISSSSGGTGAVDLVNYLFAR